MSSLVSQLEQLKKQQEGLQERIYEEEENKKKLNKEASIDRLEALVKPLTEQLDYVSDNVGHGCGRMSVREGCIKRYEDLMIYYADSKEQSLINTISPDSRLVNEEIFVTLIGILKKQDERIKELEVKTKSYLY